MFCTQCGNEVAEGAQFCSKCGYKLISVESGTGSSFRNWERSLDSGSAASDQNQERSQNPSSAASDRNQERSLDPGSAAADWNSEGGLYQGFVDSDRGSGHSQNPGSAAIGRKKPLLIAGIAVGVTVLLGSSVGLIAHFGKGERAKDVVVTDTTTSETVAAGVERAGLGETAAGDDSAETAVAGSDAAGDGSTETAALESVAAGELEAETEKAAARRWYEAYEEQLPVGILRGDGTDEEHQFLTPVQFFDFNQDGIPEIYAPTLNAYYFMYLDRELELHEEMIGAIVRVNTDGSFIAESISIQAGDPYDYTLFVYDTERGIYQKKKVMDVQPDREYVNHSYNEPDFYYLKNAQITIGEKTYSSIEKAFKDFCPEYAKVLRLKEGEWNLDKEERENNLSECLVAEAREFSRVLLKLKELAGLSDQEQTIVEDPSRWLNAWLRQLPDLDSMASVTPGTILYFDLNEDQVPEILFLDGEYNWVYYYLDRDLVMHEMLGGIAVWVLSDGTLIFKYPSMAEMHDNNYNVYFYNADLKQYSDVKKMHRDGKTWEYDGKTYASSDDLRSVLSGEFLDHVDAPNGGNYQFSVSDQLSDRTTVLEQLAKDSASTMGITSEIAAAREANGLSNGADFSDIGLEEKLKKEDFAAYVEAYCRNYTYMVTEKNFGYLQDYLFYGKKPKKGYDCVTEMQRMLGLTSIQSIDLLSVEVTKVKRVNATTVQIHTKEDYHVFLKRSMKNISKDEELKEEVLDYLGEEPDEDADILMEENIYQKVFYELKLKHNQWKFYRYVDKVEQETEILDASE